MADIKSEPRPASNRNRWPASYWNAWPGSSESAHTPWVAILDPAVTTSLQEGFYIVYILSADATRLYLSLNQGCTALKDAVGIPRAREELKRRSATMRAKLNGRPTRLRQVGINLGSPLWRASLYEAGDVLSAAYDTGMFPPEEELVADLRDALQAYVSLRLEGGWAAEDDLIKDAEGDGLKLTLTQAKSYKQHRSIERQARHAVAVKKALGTTCMGCQRSMGEVYGPLGEGLIHAHHLTPLSILAEGEIVELDPRTAFAVLCPNCHAIIHRMDDVSDIGGLKALLKSA